MSGNFYEKELHQKLLREFEAGSIREIGDSSSFFSRLGQSYPVHGSKIDWVNVPDSIERMQSDESNKIESFITFFEEMVRQFRLSGDVVYVVDSATDFALTGEIKAIREAVRELLSVPQHHYFMGPECSWCICFTMEGSMAFGISPQVTNKEEISSQSRLS